MSVEDLFGRLDEELRRGERGTVGSAHLERAPEVVLVIVDGLRTPATLVDALRRGGYETRTVADPIAAHAAVRDQSFAAVLVALETSRGSGADIAEAFARSCPGAALIVLAARPPSAPVLLKLKGVPGARLVAEGAAADDIVFALNETLEHHRGFSGAVFGFAIADLLQLCHLGGRTLTLELTGPRAGATAHFVQGQLVHAELGSLRGEEAMMVMLDWSGGRVRMVPLRSHERTIEQAMPGLLLDLMRRIDEERRARVVDELAVGATDAAEVEEDIATVVERTLGGG